MKRKVTAMNEHSAKFEKVKGYYDAGLWNEAMVKNAAGRWITAKEAELIIGGTPLDDNI